MSHERAELSYPFVVADRSEWAFNIEVALRERGIVFETEWDVDGRPTVVCDAADAPTIDAWVLGRNWPRPATT